MSWSLGETAALVQKATRGAGYPWGIAEEAATAVTWLQARGLPGIMVLCSYLGQCTRSGAAQAEPTSLTAPACPLTLGCAISDGIQPLPTTMDEVIDLGLVYSPVLLLPMLQANSVGPIWMRAHGAEFLPLRTADDLWAAGLMAATVRCEIRRGQTPQMDHPAATESRVPDRFACCVDQMTHLAHRTYAPATSQSRLSGAGAGLNDND